MNNIENDSFKQAVKRKIGEDKPINSDSDNQLWENVFNEISKDKVVITSTKDFNWYAIAASVLLVIATSLSLYFIKLAPTESKISKVEIGTPKDVSFGEISPENNTPDTSDKPVIDTKVKVNKTTSSTSVVTISSDNSVLEYKLPDGSIATLNTESSLNLNSDFGNQRKLQLQGEAYFEIKHDKTKPFTVDFENYKLLVVGTKFNIRSVDGENYKEVAVTEGIVRIFSPNDSSGIVLNKGELVRLYGNGKHEISNVVAENYISWKTKDYNFNQARLEEVVLILSRHLKEEIILDPKVKNCRFTGDLSNLTANEALKGVCMVSSLKLETIDNRIYISGAGCE